LGLNTQIYICVGGVYFTILHWHWGIGLWNLFQWIFHSYSELIFYSILLYTLENQ